VTNLYDGLFSGGLILVFSEVSAEMAYPVGESLSLGFVNALQFLIRFVFKFVVDIIVFEMDDPNRELKPNLPLAVYIILMLLFLIFTILAYFLLIKAPFILRRSMTDACLEYSTEDFPNSISIDQNSN